MGASGTGGTRNCIGCGRAISWDANVCPYCGHDYRVQMMAPGSAPKYSEGLKIILYIISFLFSIVGIIIGLVLYLKDDSESKELGKWCLILGVLGIVFSLICNFALWGVSVW